MQKVFRFWHLREARKAASLWVAKQDRGLSASEQQELFAWLAASPVHREALREFDTLWRELDKLPAFKQIVSTAGTNDRASNGIAGRMREVASGLLGRRKTDRPDS
jgi:ferric-dicitrate binding protein FerR (iron transport regulator)